ncbi:MAG: alpha/beta hydrolase [Planctomycetota bacterium]|nr:alpha/beta hydrolase [Planctomycetota bacterium]
MLGLGVLLAVGLGLAWLLVAGWTIATLVRPPRRTYASALARGRPGDPGELAPGPRGVRAWRSWTVRWGGLDLPVWEIDGDDREGPVVVLTHGWGDSRIGALTRAPHVLGRASSVVMWDLPGHGEAPGRCTLGEREVDALRAVLEALASRGPDASPPVVLFGWSLGAGVSIVAAGGGPTGSARRTPRIAGVIAEAPYRLVSTPARGMLVSMGLPHRATLGPALWAVGVWCGAGASWKGFDRAAAAARLGVPLLVIHGSDDAICPIADGRAIAAAAPHAEFCEVPGAGHSGIWTEEFRATLAAGAVGRWLDMLRSGFVHADGAGERPGPPPLPGPPGPEGPGAASPYHAPDVETQHG